MFECATNANLKPSAFTLSRLDVNVPSNMSLMGRDSPKRCDNVLTGQSKPTMNQKMWNGFLACPKRGGP